MLISGAFNNTQPNVVFSTQEKIFQADFNYSHTSQNQLTGRVGQQVDGFSSAVTISLSINAINVTTGLLAAEQLIDDTEPDDDNHLHDHTRAKGIETALKNLFKELEENDGLTSKVAKRLFKLVSTLNVARGTDTKLGQLDKDARTEVRSARQKVNDFFRAKHSTVFVEADLVNFITLVAKLETLREFALRTTDLLAALKGEGDETNETEAEEEQVPLISQS